MKPSRYSYEQIVYALRQAEVGSAGAGLTACDGEPHDATAALQRVQAVRDACLLAGAARARSTRGSSAVQTYGLLALSAHTPIHKHSFATAQTEVKLRAHDQQRPDMMWFS